MVFSVLLVIVLRLITAVAARPITTRAATASCKISEPSGRRPTGLTAVTVRTCPFYGLVFIVLKVTCVLARFAAGIA